MKVKVINENYLQRERERENIQNSRDHADSTAETALADMRPKRNAADGIEPN